MKLRLFLLVPIFALMSCSTHKIRSESASNAMLFPYGNYIHWVKIKIAPQAHEDAKEFSFKGVVQIKTDLIQIVALSPFGTTLFHIKEDRKTNQVQIECFIPALKKFEPKFNEYYAALREILITPKAPSSSSLLKITQINPEGQPTQLETRNPEVKAVFTIQKFDINGIPEKVLMTHVRFTVEIQISGYEV